VNKVLPIFVMPLFLLIVMSLAAVLTRRRGMALGAFAALWVLSTPLAGHTALRLIEAGYVRSLESDAEDADLVVVLSGDRRNAPGPAAVSEWEDADRFFAGVDLFLSGKAPTIVFTGGGPSRPDGLTEGDVLRTFALRLGVADEAIVVTGRVATTEDEADELACLVRDGSVDAPTRRILLVTSAFHVPRAERTFERRGFEVVPFPVDFRSSEPEPIRWTQFLPSSQALRSVEMAWREVIGRVWQASFGQAREATCRL
jgi:uncharacterized SAM-binding protein YcdF (DUF218 family)